MKPFSLSASLTFAFVLALSIPGCGGSGSGSDGGGNTTHMDGGGSTTHGDGGGSTPGHDGGGSTGPDACVPSFEICGDGIDENCDGMEDSCGNTDGDFFDACRPGQAPPACDCNDRDPDIYPGAPETCDGMDDDCDGAIDEIASCCAACTGMAERADTCTPTGQCVCSTDGAGDHVVRRRPDLLREWLRRCADRLQQLWRLPAACTPSRTRVSGGVCHCGTGPTHAPAT